MNKYTDKIRPQTTHSMSRRPNNRPSGSITSRCATASTLLRPTLIFDNLLSTIDKPSITNRWNLFHETKLVDYNPIEPDDSQYNVPLNFPQRPLTSHICSLTLRENERISERAIGINSPVATKPKNLNMKSSHHRLPSENDFTKILNRLEMVISNKNLGNRRVELIEGENMDNFLEMGELHYFKINTKNKRSPLRVSIKCFKGKIRSYASRTNTMPSEAASDQAFKTYDYEIADPGLKFKGDTMNLGLHAVTDANYSIVIHFGRNKDFGIPFLRNELQGNEDLQPGVSQIAKEMQKDLEIYRANMLSKRNSKSCTNIENLHKQLDWGTRRKLAAEKKNILGIEKKKRAENMIIRNIIKRQEQKKIREDNEAKSLLEAQQKTWILLINFVLSVEKLNEIKAKERKEVLFILKENGSARKLQKFYRNKNNELTANQVTILRAIPLLSLYCNHGRRLNGSQIKLSLIKQIKLSANMRTIPNQFEKFYSSATIIQISWQQYVKRKKEKWMILLDLWEEAYKKYTNNLPKGKTKSKSTPSKPVFIPDVQRDRILTEYIRDAKRKYLNDLRSYYESKIRLVSLAAESFLSTQGPSQKFSNQTPPRMVFKPRIDDIFKLIEKAFSLYIIYYETFSLSPLGVIPICIRETNPLAISAYSFESSILSAFIPKIFKGLCRSSWSSLSPTRSRA